VCVPHGGVESHSVKLAPNASPQTMLSDGQSFVLECDGEHMQVYNLLWLSYAAALLFLGACTAWMSSKVTAKLNEGKSISIAIHNSVAVALMMFPILLVVNDQNTRTFVSGLGRIMVTCTLLFPIIIPKLRVIRCNQACDDDSFDERVDVRVGGMCQMLPPSTTQVIANGKIPSALRDVIMDAANALVVMRDNFNAGLKVAPGDFEKAQKQVCALNGVIQKYVWRDKIEAAPTVTEAEIPGPHAHPIALALFSARDV